MLRCVAVCYSMLQGVTVHFIADMFRGKMMGSQVRGVAVCCSVLQCVAVCCSVLQCAALCCMLLWCIMLQMCAVGHLLPRGDDGSQEWCVAVCCSVLQCVAVCCSVLRGFVVCFSVLQHKTSETLQDTARHCKTIARLASVMTHTRTHLRAVERLWYKYKLSM